jgi:structure-specific recognition protein 1
MFYAQAKRGEIKQNNPDIKVTDVTKKLSEQWKALSSEERKVPFSVGLC